MSLTAAQLRERLTDLDIDQILSDLADAAARDAYLEESVIPGARQTLEGYAGGRYALPLADTQQVLDFEARLARFVLLRRKPWNFTPEAHADEEALTRQLRDVAARKFHLTGQNQARSAAQDMTQRPTEPSVRVRGRKRTFTRESTEGC